MPQKNTFSSPSRERLPIILIRGFGGLSVEETAVALGLSAATIGREQRLAEAWLHRELSNEG